MHKQVKRPRKAEPAFCYPPYIFFFSFWDPTFHFLFPPTPGVCVLTLSYGTQLSEPRYPDSLQLFALPHCLNIP